MKGVSMRNTCLSVAQLEPTHHNIASYRENALTNLAIQCSKDTCSTREMRHSIFVVFMPEAGHNSIYREKQAYVYSVTTSLLLTQ